MNTAQQVTKSGLSDMMILSELHQSSQTSSRAAGMDADPRPGSVRSASPCTRIIDNAIDTSFHNAIDASCKTQQMTREGIKAVLYQLQKNLIESVRMVLALGDQTCQTSPHEANVESSIETAIKQCVNSTLERWILDSNTDSSPQVEKSTLHNVGISDSYLSPVHKATTEPPSTSSDLPNTALQMPDECPPDASLTDQAALRRRARKANWENHRDNLHRLYIREQKPLPDVIRIMADRYGFKATPKQYRYQIGSKWSWKKYNATEMRPSSHPSSQIKATYNECEGENEREEDIRIVKQSQCQCNQKRAWEEFQSNIDESSPGQIIATDPEREEARHLVKQSHCQYSQKTAWEECQSNLGESFPRDSMFTNYAYDGENDFGLRPEEFYFLDPSVKRISDSRRDWPRPINYNVTLSREEYGIH
ncbi:Clr5 domain-containing protein [Xylaria arbuscula]|nr:Clr5 domain-containing protein [Xylaria arbuscula]